MIRKLRNKVDIVTHPGDPTLALMVKNACLCKKCLEFMSLNKEI